MARPEIGAILLALAVNSMAGASSASLLSFELRSLDEPLVHSLARYQGKTTLMVFFQPDCPWCLKQIRSINQLVEACPDALAAVAVGIHGTRAALQREKRRLKPAFPAYQASPDLLRELGGVAATPVTLLGDVDGGVLGWHRGLAKSQQLSEMLRTRAGLDCSP